jgi:two-component system, chemotaxis family, sensor kinase CheA
MSGPMAIAGVDDPALRRAFIEETEDLHAKLGQALMALEQDNANAEAMNEAFRCVHSIKSESALMAFETLCALAHAMEDVLDRARGGALALDRAVMDLEFTGLDRVGEMLAAIGAGGTDGVVAAGEVLRGLSEAAARAGGAPAGTAKPAPAQAADAGAPTAADPAATRFDGFQRHQLAEARDRGETLFLLRLRVDEAEPMKFPRVYLVFNNLELSANVVRTEPQLDGPPLDDAAYAEAAFYLTSRDGSDALQAAARVDQVSVVSLEPVDYALALGGPPPAAAAPPAPAGEAPSAPVAEEATRRPAQPERPTIRVDTRKLDDLWSLVAELVTRKSRVARLSEKVLRAASGAAGNGGEAHEVGEELAEASDALDKIAGGMQRAMMDTRMVPISVIFGKFPRLVRDLSRKLGKSIDLVLSGEETEIDRGLLDALSDPLTHLIRNAIDHGIEYPEERVRQGKPARGKVAVSARQQGGNVVVEITDDGVGIDVARVREKAVRDGIPGATGMDDAGVLDLVFRPGFSTREVVTDVSGRGVGMDVVATRVREELKGSVVLATDKGRGTRVTLLLPLTLTIVSALLVRADRQACAIPLADVESTVKVLNTEVRGDGETETWIYRDEEIPLFRLAGLLGRGSRRAEEHFAVILRHGGRKGCLVVDELVEQQQVVIRPVDDLLNHRRLFSGVSLLEDGELVFILDTSFIRQEEF